MLKSDDSSNASTNIADQGANVKIMINSEQQKEIEKPLTVQNTINVSQQYDMEKVTPDTAAVTPALQQKPTEKAKKERTRVESAPETLPSTEEKKPVILEVLANGEDESDRREHEKRRNSQDGRKRSSLKVPCQPDYMYLIRLLYKYENISLGGR